MVCAVGRRDLPWPAFEEDFLEELFFDAGVLLPVFFVIFDFALELPDVAFFFVVELVEDVCAAASGRMWGATNTQARAATVLIPLQPLNIEPFLELTISL